MSLTPLEWFEEQAIAKAQRDAQRRDLASQEGELRHWIRQIYIYFRIQVLTQVFYFIQCLLEHTLVRI